MRRYPRDPRSYSRLQATLGYHGALDEAERVALQQLAIDSLAMTAGNGPCTPCMNYFSIVNLRWQRGDYRGAADWARKWIQIQPDGASAWSALAWSYSYMQRPDSALSAMQRAYTLSGGDLWAREGIARLLIVSRRYGAADSAIAAMNAGPRTTERIETVADLRSILARERGQYRASNGVMKDLAVASPNSLGFTEIVTADNLRLLGNYAEAARRHDAMVHPASLRLTLPIPTGSARAFCWSHALAADAYAPVGTTTALEAIADTLEAGCTRSFYARDWRLYHHVRGLVAAKAHRYADAEREFKQATWTLTEGWSRTPVELANAQAALGRPRDAIASLRTAYATRLDAMGRYAPISELDYHMSRLFAQAGEGDSARVYAGYARRAWSDADPEVRRLLATLP
jgi:tetratricopeptide (TPR) repeat protein